MVRHGVPRLLSARVGANVHTIEEYVDLVDFKKGCRLALALATHLLDGSWCLSLVEQTFLSAAFTGQTEMSAPPN